MKVQREVDPMADGNAEFLDLLLARLGEELPGLRMIESGLCVDLEGRYGRLRFVLDYDPDARSIRVYTSVPAPPGSGPEFLRWCLAMNTAYWDVKVGLGADGMLLVISDIDLVDASPPEQVAGAARLLSGRVVAIGQLVDEDLVAHLLQNRLATAAQRTRWEGWQPA